MGLKNWLINKMRNNSNLTQYAWYRKSIGGDYFYVFDYKLYYYTGYGAYWMFK